MRRTRTRRPASGGIRLSSEVLPHTLPHSFAMHMLYNHGHPKVNQALLGHEKSESSDVYTKVFSLDVAARQQVRFNRETGAVLQLQRATPAP